MQVNCSFIRARYQGSNGYTVAEYIVKDASDFPSRMIARGHHLPTDSYFDITLEGEMLDDPAYGPTFEVSCFKTSVKKTRQNVIGYLSSGVIKGVGKSTAENIVDYFGLEAAEILMDNPLRLKEVSGIGDKTLDMIMESYKDNKAIHGLMEYLGQYKVTIKQGEKIVAKFGSRSLELVKNDIYHLCDVRGFGFKTVDNIAKNMNHPLDTFPRVKAAGIYVLGENRKNGHLFMEPKKYLAELKKQLNHKKAGFRFDNKSLRQYANQTLLCGEILYADKMVYLHGDFDAENEAAKLLIERLLSPFHEQKQLILPLEITSEKLNLSEEQQVLIKLALYFHTFIITGGPGTGKTATLDGVLKYYEKLYGKKKVIALCAPTGRAARRMGVLTGLPASTIHRQFKLFADVDDFASVSDRFSGKLEVDLVVIDEASMVDMSLFYQVLSRLKHSTKLIIVGDPNQLPSVQPGNVLHEILNLSILPSMRLTKVFRQADGTSIAENADRIQKGETELIYDNSFLFQSAGSAEMAREIITELYLKAAKLVGFENVQVLSPMRTKTECGTNRLNRVLQAYAHRSSENLVHDTRHSFQAGDLVIQNKNKDGINNGDMGKVMKVTSHAVTVKFFEYQTPQIKTYRQESLKLIELAYALTVHKSQGSEYPIVIIPVLMKHRHMLKRNLFYTGITRGELRVVLVGQMEAVEWAITHEDTSRRNTLFSMRIQRHYDNKKRMMLWGTQEDLRKSA